MGSQRVGHDWVTLTFTAGEVERRHDRSHGWVYWEPRGMATYSSILAWRIPWREEPGRLQSTRSQRVGPDWVTKPFTFHEGKRTSASAAHFSDDAYKDVTPTPRGSTSVVKQHPRGWQAISWQRRPKSAHRDFFSSGECVKASRSVSWSWEVREACGKEQQTQRDRPSGQGDLEWAPWAVTGSNNEDLQEVFFIECDPFRIAFTHSYFFI